MESTPTGSYTIELFFHPSLLIPKRDLESFRGFDEGDHDLNSAQLFSYGISVGKELRMHGGNSKLLYHVTLRLLCDETSWNHELY
uniref:Uncharacterized protein n=1 Tax=Salix viminalis TaxID=40686 RepID=A0A6N2L805_SALVM